MRKYLSCVILIVICIIGAMIFYVNANNLFGSDDTINSDSDSNVTNDIGESKDNVSGDTTDDVQIATIEKEGTILSEYFTNTNLRIEYAIYKLEKENNLYLSCEMYIDTKTPITNTSKGYLSVNGTKKEFTLNKTLGTSTLLTSMTSSIDFKEGDKINIEGFLDVSISDNSGVTL